MFKSQFVNQWITSYDYKPNFDGKNTQGKDLTFLKIPLPLLYANFPVEGDQKSHLNQITFNEGLTVGDLRVGRAQDSSGERFDEEESSIPNDWAVIDITSGRNGRNAFPIKGKRKRRWDGESRH
jgi:hypothetical protein